MVEAGTERQNNADKASSGESNTRRYEGSRSTRKSPTAYRTISEVSEELDIPQHVLRFWETKFTQVRPLKRGGGRRYYRPEDIVLLRRIQALLYKEGYTIKGVQKLLREGRAAERAQSVLTDNEGLAKPPAADAMDDSEDHSVAADSQSGPLKLNAAASVSPETDMTAGAGDREVPHAVVGHGEDRKDTTAVEDVEAEPSSDPVSATTSIEGSDLPQRFRAELEVVLRNLRDVRRQLSLEGREIGPAASSASERPDDPLGNADDVRDS
jgi:DNA-binding transcriptional MerR regulator